MTRRALTDARSHQDNVIPAAPMNKYEDRTTKASLDLHWISSHRHQTGEDHAKPLDSVEDSRRKE